MLFLNHANCIMMPTKIQVKIYGQLIEIERRDGKYVKPDILKRVEGYNVALKPAVELILLARKPLSEKNIAANILRWGTGGLNIDGCRIGTDGGHTIRTPFPAWRRLEGRTDKPSGKGEITATGGRWPANVALDPEAARLLDKQSGERTSGMMKPGQRRKASRGKGGYHDDFPDEASATGTYGDTGGASRFFYCAKASRAERKAGLQQEGHRVGAINTHPT